VFHVVSHWGDQVRSEETWRKRYNRPFKPKPHRVPYSPTPGLDRLAAYLKKLRKALTG
jgi:hypothetical protein